MIRQGKYSAESHLRGLVIPKMPFMHIVDTTNKGSHPSPGRLMKHAADANNFASLYLHK